MLHQGLFILLLLCSTAPWLCQGALRSRSSTSSLDDHQSSKVEEESRRILQASSSSSLSSLSSVKTIDQMMIDYQVAKARLLGRLEQDYGPDNFETLWMDTKPKQFNSSSTGSNKKTCTIGRTAFWQDQGADISWRKTVRKMKLNILQYLISGNVQDFVWATAGNTDAAGHGNFFNQQYTMVMADRAQDLLAQVGLRLVARPFARGGATSAPELAACAKEIYGTDIDIITWDFAMTDGRTHWRIEFFAHRVHILPNHPVLMVLQAGTDEGRKELVEHLTVQGMTALRQDERYVMDRKMRFPDSNGKSKEELDAMPEYVRYFKCGYGIETRAECTTHRFTQNGTCDDRENMNHWHHGWKWHAYHGNLYALFLMETVEDALHELKQEAEDLEALYKRLTKEEQDEYDKFEKEADLLYGHKWDVHDAVTAMELYRDHTYCHTANIPAQTRYLGYVYNDEKNDDWIRYYHGETLKTRRNKNPVPELLLTYIPPPRETKYNCNHTLHIDSKDFFLATGRYDGFQTVVIPNDMEVKAYGDHKPKGILAVCAAACSFECAKSPLLSPDAIHKEIATFQVNGEKVDQVISFENCFLLVRKDGTLHWPNRGDNRYELGVKVHIGGKFFRFSSFILW